jgi:serine/threonine protein kinase
MAPDEHPHAKTSPLEEQSSPIDHDAPHDEQLSPQEQKLFEQLDRYVSSLHAGDINSLSGLIERHPELADLMGCLDSLEILAPTEIAEKNDYAVRKETAATADVETVVLSSDNKSSSGNVETGSAAKLEPFQEFGKYELLEEIGRGGMGVVYRARQKDLDRDVAVKMILSSRLASKEDVRRFYAEAKAAGSLRHPNIVGIHEVGEINGQHYFAMDYIDCESLAELLENGAIDDETAAQCLLEVARAVDFLHKHHIVHRDLKPSNVLVDDDGIPFVTDFGLAKIFDSDSGMTQTGTIVGTPSYMSPEQAAGRNSEISPQSDVYSLGAILYEMLTGRPPFKQKSALDTLVEVLEGEPTLPSKLNRAIPSELELICLQCLQKDPAKRYESALTLAEDLDCFLKREPISARPSGIFQKLRRWSRREPALVSRWIALILTAGIVQIIYLIYKFTGSAEFDPEYHLKIMSVFGVWAVVSFLFQRLLNRESIATIARFSWAAADLVLLTTLLCIADPPLGPLLIGYPLLVAASGLFFRVRLVIFTTGVAIAAYLMLVFRLKPDSDTPLHYPIIYAAVLAVLGIMVGYQVYRIRVLSRYYDHRHLP